MASPVVGSYPPTDTAIVDPPTWFTAVPATMTSTGVCRGPTSPAGFWPQDEESATAAGSAVVAHGRPPPGRAVAVFALNPLYRADPEREWPMVATSAYWVDR